MTQTSHAKPPKKPKSSRRLLKKKPPRFTAATADRHELYQLAVQNVEAEIDFVDATFKTIRGQHASTLREDFCGTGNTSCEWVRRRATNRAIGLDIDPDPLAWGEAHNLSQLTDDQRSRVSLIQRDVLAPGDAVGTQIVLAMNFSYWLFRTRDELRTYFSAVYDSLADDGVFFLDHYGGYESMEEQEEERNIDSDFTYIWDQHHYNPITGEMDCKIHFKFRDGTRLDNAFVYTWRLWTLPEIREILAEAGFANITVYWEGEDEDDPEEGNGEFSPTMEGTADASFICYLTAVKS